jgi:hypothetical protein
MVQYAITMVSLPPSRSPSAAEKSLALTAPGITETSRSSFSRQSKNTTFVFSRSMFKTSLTVNVGTESSANFDTVASMAFRRRSFSSSSSSRFVDMFAAFVTGTKTELLLLFFGERENSVLRDENDRCEKDAKTEEEENDRDDDDDDDDATTTTAAAIPWEMMMIFYTKAL